MSIWLSVILCALLGYLLGCINPAYLIARARGSEAAAPVTPVHPMPS